jgi:hypothetical protein
MISEVGFINELAIGYCLLHNLLILDGSTSNCKTDSGKLQNPVID